MLLFDGNLSRKLPALVEEHLGKCLHVNDLNLQHAADLEVWTIARQNQYTIVSKDSDFYYLLMSKGHPPKVIWLKMGNISTAEISKHLFR